MQVPGFSPARASLIRETDLLRAFHDEPLEAPDYEAAAKANNDCRAKGVAVTTVDILICAIAMRRGWSIFTTDPDFKSYANILPIKLHSPRK